MKTKILISVLAVVAVVFFAQQKNAAKEDALFIENLEALTFDEGGSGGNHGEVDPTLEPYKKLSYKWVNIGNMGLTKIPCCATDESQYSGCAKGLDNC